MIKYEKQIDNEKINDYKEKVPRENEIEYLSRILEIYLNCKK